MGVGVGVELIVGVGLGVGSQSGCIEHKLAVCVIIAAKSPDIQQI